MALEVIEPVSVGTVASGGAAVVKLAEFETVESFAAASVCTKCA